MSIQSLVVRLKGSDLKDEDIVQEAERVVRIRVE
jgi:hypothetical protein